MDFDVYSNVDEITINEEYNKLKKSNEDLQDHIKKLENDVSKLCNEMSKMKTIQDSLSTNISELFTTAKNEIERKDKYITNLRRQLDDLLFKRNNKNTIPPKSGSSDKLEDGELEEHSDSKLSSTRELDSDDRNETKDRRNRQPINRYYRNRSDDRRERYSKPNLNDRKRYNSPTERSRYRDSRRGDNRNTLARSPKNKRWISPSPERHRHHIPKRYKKGSKSPPLKESDFKDKQKQMAEDLCKELNSKSKSQNVKFANIEENRVNHNKQNVQCKQNQTMLSAKTESNIANSNSDLEIPDNTLEKVDIVECKIKQKMSLDDYRNKFADKNKSSDLISIDGNAIDTEKQLTIVKSNEQISKSLNHELMEDTESILDIKKITNDIMVVDQKADNSKNLEALTEIYDSETLPTSTSLSTLNESSSSQDKLNVVKVPKKKKRWTMLLV